MTASHGSDFTRQTRSPSAPSTRRGGERSHDTHRRRQQRQPQHEPGIQRILLRLVDLGLAAAIFIAPLFMGGRGDVGKLALMAAVGFASCMWLLRQSLTTPSRWRLSGAEWLLIAGLGLVILQLIPLPQDILLKLSPEVGRILPIWTTDFDPGLRLGQWNQITFTPEATRGGLAVYLTYALLFCVLIQRIEGPQDVELCLKAVALAALSMAALGMAQMLMGNGKFLWVFDHPSRDTFGVAKGAFQNQNHFAHFLILGLGPVIWWLHQTWVKSNRGRTSFGHAGSELNQWLRFSLTAGLLLLFLAVLLTFSRGGVATLLVASSVTVAIYVREGIFGKKAMLAFAGGSVVLIAALGIFGSEKLMKRLGTMATSESLEELSQGRQALWAAHLEAIPHFALTGTGIGSHREIYRTYLDKHFGVEFTHGENGYLHLLLEAGFPALGLLLVGFLFITVWLGGLLHRREDRQVQLVTAAVLPGIVASVFHSLGDFVWYIPACVTMTLFLVACACRQWQLCPSNNSGRCQPHSYPWWLTGKTMQSNNQLHAAMGLLFLIFMVGMLLSDQWPRACTASAWHEYFRLARQKGDEVTASDDPALPDDDAAMATHLQSILQRYPANARANLRLASIKLRAFDAAQQASANPMTLAQIRDAALASQFPSLEEQDRWLSVVMGANKRLLNEAMFFARRAVRLCPLQGDGYIYLAELSFLEGAPREAVPAYIEQALAVRPHNALVMMAAGQEAVLAGDLPQAMRLWKQAFHADASQQKRVIEMLAPQMPGSAFITEFKPDLGGMRKLFSFYKANGRLEDAKQVGVVLVDELEDEARQQSQPKEAAYYWYYAAIIHNFLGDVDQATVCAEQAVAHAPDNYSYHFLFACTLTAAKAYDQAVEQFEWCIARKPEDQALRNRLASVARLRVAHKGQPTKSVH